MARLETLPQPRFTREPAPAAKAATAARETDFDLLRRFAGLGDAAAFAQIVQRYAGFVYATCLRVIGDPARAEDLSQETFFRLMRRPHEVNQNLGGWLHRTATHLAVDTLRSESSRRKREIVYTQECDHEASSWAELSPMVDQALSEMPEEPRMLLMQHFLLGKSQSDLAEELNVSPSTICRRIQQGLEDMRVRLRLKGVYALPAALAALLCHVTARQAPASLTVELGKMALFSGASAAARMAQFGSADPVNHPPRGRLLKRVWSPQTFHALLAMVGAIIVLRFLTAFTWPSAAQPHNEPDPPAKSTRTAAMVLSAGFLHPAMERPSAQ
jgi:RNA polymerase sigma factor (sigma-70 family)